MNLAEVAPIAGASVAVAVALGALIWKVVKTLLDQRFRIQEEKAEGRFKVITERIDGFKSALDRLTDRIDDHFTQRGASDD